VSVALMLQMHLLRHFGTAVAAATVALATHAAAAAEAAVRPELPLQSSACPQVSLGRCTLLGSANMTN
jgi:hypothetical protein